MRTPICSFIENYALSDKARLHMPGHKGRGSEVARYDITEIEGADSLYEAEGIIRESEQYASGIFGARTYYSAEGSSLCIRAMIYLVGLLAKSRGEKVRIAAARNVHRVFVSAAALLDVDVDWISSPDGSYLSCRLCARDVEEYFDSAENMPTALYLTSPDYLGNICDVEGIARVCHERGVLLIVDNAHGAYLNFLSPSRHPISLGADMCCDSAHKTLSALTGAAYLHVSESAPELFSARAREALAMFGSTSPSYLILASLDALNVSLAGDFPKRLAALCERLDDLKRRLCKSGYVLVGDEPMKLTLYARAVGYTGRELADILMDKGIVAEFSDPDFVVLMPSVDTSEDELARLLDALLSVERREALTSSAPVMTLPRRAMSVREAVMSDCELLDVRDCQGRVLAAVTVSCPPAVPIAVSGEVLDGELIRCFEYYGIKKCSVVKQ